VNRPLPGGEGGRPEQVDLVRLIQRGRELEPRAGLVAAIAGASTPQRVAAAGRVAEELGRPMYRLELDGLAQPGAVVPAISALLDAAAVAAATVLIDGADVLVPGARPGPSEGTAERWTIEVGALALREQLRRHRGVVLLEVTTATNLHASLASVTAAVVTLR
jgi:hypothetical protein